MFYIVIVNSLQLFMRKETKVYPGTRKRCSQGNVNNVNIIIIRTLKIFRWDFNGNWKFPHFIVNINVWLCCMFNKWFLKYEYPD